MVDVELLAKLLSYRPRHNTTALLLSTRVRVGISIVAHMTIPSRLGESHKIQDGTNRSRGRSP